MKLGLCSWLIVLVAVTSHVTAQVERTLPSRNASTLEGTSFIVGFMQNEIWELPDERVLKVFISSQYDANVQLEFATGAITNITVRANDVAVIDLPQIYMMFESEVARKRSLFVTSDVPVVVYALNSIVLSTDSYTALPIKALGQQYYTVNRPNDQYLPTNDPNGNDFNLAVRQSEFMIMAVEENTVVEITPTFITEKGFPAGQTRTVTLQRGDCYLVKSYDVPISLGDLTGSKIVSTKPVAVLSGAVRSGVPVAQQTSKDHLVEMLPPVNSWGNSYAAVPFAMISKWARNKIRFVASQDNTQITVQTAGVKGSITIPKAGGWTELDILEPTYYTSDKPFLAVQFMPSRQYNPLITQSQNGDPAMVVLPATDQYLASTMFRFPELLAQDQLPNQNFYYFVTIVTEAAAVSTLQVNGSLVSSLDPAFTTQQIPGTTLQWVNLQLPLGMYTISADSGLFGGIMYGMSQADSYANLFGANYGQAGKRSPTRPAFAMSVTCGEVQGSVFAIPDSIAKLSDVTVQTTRCKNYRWELVGPTDTAGTTDIRAWVTDLWKDAVFVVHAYDSSGAGREWLYEYEAPKLSMPSSIQIEGVAQGTSCKSIPISNDAAKPMHIKSIQLTGDASLSITSGPKSDTLLAAGDTVWVRVCLDNNSVLANGSIVVELDCGLERTIPIKASRAVSIAVLDVDLGSIRIGDTACGKAPIVNRGSRNVVITRLGLSNLSPLFNVDFAALNLPYLLAPGDTLWIPVCLTPGEEKSYARSDTVVSAEAGSVVVVYRGRGVRPRIPSIEIDWGNRRVGSKSDTTFSLMNTGSFAASIDTVPDANVGTGFSIGGPGFPVTIVSNDSEVCTSEFSPNAETAFIDTLELRVDWKPHEPVFIVLKGRGTLPAVRTIDVDMGDVVIGTSKDSAALVVTVSGTEVLTVSAFSENGADQTSFGIGSGLAANRTYLPGEQISIPIRFSPTRLGLHQMSIELQHDAAPFGVVATSTIRIVGNGVPRPNTRLEAQLLISSPLTACRVDSAGLEIKNVGNTTIQIDNVVIELDGVEITPTLPAPLIINASDQMVIPFELAVNRLNVAVIDVTISYNGSQTLSLKETRTVVVLTPDVSISMPPTTEAGDNLQATLNVSQDELADVAQPITLTVLYDSFQWNVPSNNVLVTVTDVAGSRTETIAPLTISGGISLTLGESVMAPYTISTKLVGRTLLNTFGGVLVRGRVEPNVCSDSASDTGLSTITVCGGALRLVKIQGRPLVTARVGENPVTNGLSVYVEASESTSISIELISTDSGIIVQNHTVQLEKGNQHCNFSVKSLVSGLYGLVIRDVRGEQFIPIVIVN